MSAELPHFDIVTAGELLAEFVEASCGVVDESIQLVLGLGHLPATLILRSVDVRFLDHLVDVGNRN